ncbi:ABC transporter substrate-binding protein [Aquamicrobium sp. LC103]|uniref:ABC transporter substrate-binding protein n=1 Tax=Aquamicrobium sp. LC103 TaxID=1120658 RepID=UPI00063E94EA|nr:ABC transporter substrate-binding protein [Aquamicrobium sp. LC103]TKT81039.1 ABC transporter substrate-binding protein [Aquamicrobium sp. LC103]
MKKLLLHGCILAFLSSPVVAQEINVVREVDSNNYDPHKSTARAAAEVLFMVGDTLVSLEPDMKTISDGLAKSWEVSQDGKTYTFHLKDGIKFCDGREMTAEDVVYSFKRWIDPETKSPVEWRAGEVKSITAPDPKTVVYELEAPFSELLYQLTQSFATIIDKADVERLGKDFGVTGLNGTGPYCWGEWLPRDRMTITRHEGYDWGPTFYTNEGAPHLAKITWQIVPEENTRTVALMTSQSQVTQYIPQIALAQLRNAPNIEIHRSDEAFWTWFIGFKVDKPTVADTAVRRAMNLAVDQEALARDILFGEVTPAYSYISENALDWDNSLNDSLLRYDPEEAKRILDEAGWVPGSDGIRAKDGVKLEPLTYIQGGSTWQKLAEFTQAELLKVGIGMQIQIFDPTIFWGRVATQEFDAFGMSYPYISAGDALNLYFLSQNIPTPNRMNWNDEETDDLLAEGRHATDDATRATAYGKVLKKVHDAAVWLPLYHEPMNIVQSNLLEPIVPHNNYGAGLYKGLDLKFRD